MVASRESMEQSPDAIASEMTTSMEAHAASGDWERVEEITVKLRAAVMQVPESRRRELLLAVGRSIEKVQTLAQDARHEVTDRLSAIRRGKDAAAAYESATGTERVLGPYRPGP